MNKYSVEISPKLYLETIEVPFPESPVAPSNVNHIWIYDRSGSMYHLLPELANDLIRHSKSLKVGDTLSLGWFSTEGTFNFMIKGFKIVGTESYRQIEELVLRNSSVIGLTCFSDILMNASQVVEDVSVFGRDFSLMFFTDGYPVVQNYQHEFELIFRAIDRLRGRVETALMVGYGDYYNKELLAQMAEELGGLLIHASHLSDFTYPMANWIISSRHVRRTEIDLGYNPILAFTFDHNHQQVILSSHGGRIFAPVDCGYIWVITDSDHGYTKESIESYESILYATAVGLVKTNKTDLALELMYGLGDVRLIDQIANAWTNEEFGRVEKEIANAYEDIGKRFLRGRNTKYKPDPNAYCLIDLMDMLIESETMFHPYSKSFRYKRIGVPRQTKEGYPKFEPVDRGIGVPFSDLVWNQKRLNLSVRTRIPGTIELDDTGVALGLPKTFATFIWRNYTIIKDGVLNTTEIPISCTRNMWEFLVSKELIDVSVDDFYDQHKTFVLHLDRLPIVNRSIIENRLSATEFCNDIVFEKKWMARLKVYRYFLNLLEPQQARVDDEEYTPEQSAYLDSIGISKDGSFSPPTVEQHSIDFYIAKEFDVKVAGLSSFPKVDDVIDRLKEGRKQTAAGNLLARAAERYMEETAGMSNLDKIVWLKHNIANGKESLDGFRTYSQRVKFSILMQKRWFDDLDIRDGAVVEAGGYQCKFSIKEITVEY